MFHVMKDESLIFSVLKQEISSDSGVDQCDIHLDSRLVDDLGLYDEDVERVLIEVQDVICSDVTLVGSNSLVDCLTVRDLMDAIADIMIDSGDC
jgi:hypothetical protein